MNVESRCPTHYACTALIAVFLGAGLAHGDALDLKDAALITTAYVDGEIVVCPAGGVELMGQSFLTLLPKQTGFRPSPAVGHFIHLRLHGPLESWFDQSCPHENKETNLC